MDGKNNLTYEKSSDESSNESSDESDKIIDYETLMQEIGHKVAGIHCCKDLKCQSCFETWKHIYNILANEGEPLETKRLGDFLVSLGFVELLQKLILNETDDEDALAGIWPSILMNLTDVSQKACFELMHLKLHETIIERLKIGATKSAASSVQLSILYNVIQEVETARETFRELKIVELLQQFIRIRGDDDDLYYTSIILMAWVINEDENDIIDNKDVFNYLEQQLKSSLEDESHRSSDGYKSTEILAVINKLAVNDANKKRIIESGILRHYASFLSPSCDNKEQFLAAQGVWTLALSCPEDVKKDRPCRKGLGSLLQSHETHDDVKLQVTGALKELNDTSGGRKGIRPKSTPSAAKDGGNSKKIFISYQHGYKEIVHQVRDYLKACGYEVWIDVDKLSGSLAEDICDGIDSCSVVLAFLSQKYHESPYCKKELIYADQNSKEIIPLTVEPRYKPHGWLSFRIADKLRIDFSGREGFEDSITALNSRIREILGTKDYPDHGKSIEPVIVKEISRQQNTSTYAAKVPDVSSWTEAEVMEWLKKHDLKKLKKLFDGYNGRMLLEYKSLLKEAPEATAKYFLKNFSSKYLIRLRLALADF